MNTAVNKSLSKYSIFKAQSSIIEKNIKHKTLVIPAQAGIQCVADIFYLSLRGQWIPAFAGMTAYFLFR